MLLKMSSLFKIFDFHQSTGQQTGHGYRTGHLDRGQKDDQARRLHRQRANDEFVDVFTHLGW